MIEQIQELASKNLGCWCRPSECHGDVLQALYAQNVLKAGGGEPNGNSSDPAEQGASNPKWLAAAARQREFAATLDKDNPLSFNQLACAGTELLKGIGHWLRTVRALRKDWFANKGNHLEGVLDDKPADKIPPDILE